MELEQKRILVVGASGVLGAEISRLLVSEGAFVMGTASSADSAQRIPEVVGLRLLVDLASSQNVRVLTDYLKQNETIDGIIVAAGRVGFGMAADTPSDQAQTLMQLNHLGPAQLINELAPALAGREDAFVAAITGVVAEKSFAGMSAYCASKSALSSWLAAVSGEWRRNRVRVIDLRPGHTETGLATRPLFGSAPTMPPGMTPQHVAKVIVEAIKSGASSVASSEF